MKKLHFFFLFVFALTVGALPVSAMTPEDDPADTSAEIWKVITTANNHQVITVHLNEKLAVQIHQVEQLGITDDFSFKIADQTLLKSTLGGGLCNTSTGENDSYLWVFQPLTAGQTTLTFTKRYALFFSKQYAEFTINVVE